MRKIALIACLLLLTLSLRPQAFSQDTSKAPDNAKAPELAPLLSPCLCGSGNGRGLETRE